jgi:menaquinol-cytochrome c reductase iron-sulfur subunit
MNDQSSNTVPQNDRRGFILAALYSVGALITAGLGIPAFRYLLRPPRGSQKTQWIDAGNLEELQPGTPEKVSFIQRRVDGWEVVSEKTSAWVVKHPEGAITAFSPWCTHLGCAYHWSENKHEFVCPCHGSRFSVDGQVLRGPAPRPLDRYEVRVAGTRVWLKPAVPQETARS